MASYLHGAIFTTYYQVEDCLKTCWACNKLQQKSTYIFVFIDCLMTKFTPSVYTDLDYSQLGCHSMLLFIFAISCTKNDITC